MLFRHPQTASEDQMHVCTYRKVSLNSGYTALAVCDSLKARLALHLIAAAFAQRKKKKKKKKKKTLLFHIKLSYSTDCKRPVVDCEIISPQTLLLWAQRLINLEIPVLVRSLKSSNVELG